MGGSLIVVRRAGRPEFTEREVELFDRASALFARAVRRELIAEACDSTVPLPDAPGVIELDRAGGVLRLSSSAEPLLAELSGDTVEAGIRSPAVHAVAAATRDALSAAGASGPVDLPSARVKTPAGSWLVLHGGVLGRGRGRAIAVFVQRAHPTLVPRCCSRPTGSPRGNRKSPS